MATSHHTGDAGRVSRKCSPLAENCERETRPECLTGVHPATRARRSCENERVGRAYVLSACVLQERYSPAQHAHRFADARRGMATRMLRLTIATELGVR